MVERCTGVVERQVYRCGRERCTGVVERQVYRCGREVYRCGRETGVQVW